MSDSESHADESTDREPSGRQVRLTPPASMERSLVIAAGVLATVIASYVGLVAIPDWQVDRLEPVELEDGSRYPEKLTDSERRGREVYKDLGCMYCHSQQVRQNDFGGDISRGWGRRASVPLDYTREETPLMGTMRTGPDLRNVGARQPSRRWHYLHLYDPQITSPGSTMPRFEFLFDHVSADQRTNVPRHRIEMSEDEKVPGQYVVTTRRARDLVAYLLSLDYQQKLPASANRGTDPEKTDP